MTLAVDVRRRFGAFELEARFETGGRLVALLGASGSGKTSLVNLIAGMLEPDAGTIAVDGRVLVDTAARLVVPAHRRRIGYVFQDARLFPHLTVKQNLRYGSWFNPAAERYADFDRIVELLALTSLLDRRPSLLSGGEKQRVAIGRALLASPRLILMDEPLASLDEARKAEILPYVEQLRDELKVPIVYVSHSVAEAARLATDIVVMSAGKVSATGPAAAILRRLELLPEEERGEGGAIVDMRVVAHDHEFGMSVLASRAGEIRVAGTDRPVGTPVRIRVRARDVLIATERPFGLSAQNVLPGQVRSVETGEGAAADIVVDCGGEAILARVTRHAVKQLGLVPGRAVFAVMKTVSFERGDRPPSVGPDVDANLGEGSLAHNRASGKQD